MISPVTSAVLTGGIVTTANLINKHSLSFRQLAGVGIFVIFLAMMNEANSDLASKFGLAVLITTTFLYVPKIFSAIGLDR